MAVPFFMAGHFAATLFKNNAWPASGHMQSHPHFSIGLLME